MSPEQARGDAIDHRADLYALGSIAYRALTGHRPFPGEEAASTLVAVINHRPLRPTSLADLHGDVDLALAVAMAKQPRDRSEIAGQLTEALRAACDGALSLKLRKRGKRLLSALPWSDDARPSRY